MLHVLESASTAARIAAALRFADETPRQTELLIVGASRGAADELARDLARRRAALFGVYRFSLTQLAARLAAPALAAARLAPTTPLGVQAVAARAAFDADGRHELRYFAPVARTPGFPRALARTLEELAAAAVTPRAVGAAPDVGPDLAALYESFEEQFARTSSVDRAAFFRAAAAAAARPAAWPAGCRLILLDVAIANAAERELVTTLVDRAPDAAITIPKGDRLARSVCRSTARSLDDGDEQSLARVARHLFETTAPTTTEPLDSVELFSAPGEGREAVEIARRVLREARRGVPFDRIAVALRSPQHYASVLEHAFARAGIPAYFDRGTRRPHPAGRAFLAILACAIEGLSARRFAEYLSLGQVPDRDGNPDSYPSSSDEVFGSMADRVEAIPPDDAEPQPPLDEIARGRERAARASWRWESLLVEARVIGGADRWERRLGGLIQEYDLRRRELLRTEPDSPQVDGLRRRAADLADLRAFALPLVSTLAAWPAQARWGEWLAAFEALAPRVVRRPERVLRVIADLRPMATIGPIGLAEAAQVLADRLTTIEADPPARRYGRVFVASPAQLRGRSFAVVFVPGLAERMFPQKPREDPLLLDAARETVAPMLPDQGDRADDEKLHLRLAVGAAEERLYASFPTIETGEGRPRVPSLYALEIWRAMTGRVPSASELQQTAAHASRASLAWPAPDDRESAIDPLEHDLATLRRLVQEPESRARGRAQYMLQLNASLQRSVRERYMRGTQAWSYWDGLTRVTDATRPVLAANRLGARPYSLSALQKYAACPYQFLLSAIHRLRPPDDVEPIQRLNPLTRGSLFHAVQAAFYRRLREEGTLPVTEASREAAFRVLDETVRTVADDYYQELAPAIDRVWHDEIGGIRRDLRLWVDQIARADEGWVPKWFEWSFGLKPGEHEAARDPESRPEPITVDGRFHLRGSIDLVEEKAGTGELRVTDHKTGRYRGKDHMLIGGGEVLQPVLYSIALETATDRPVVEGRLYYATTDGGYREVRIPLSPQARRAGIEALEIVDRAIETGFLAPAPKEKACTWCDFRPVCGPTAERRIGRYKSHLPLADLLELRRRP